MPYYRQLTNGTEALVGLLAGQGKVVTSLDVDHSGSRLLAGSRDYSLRMFDFNGMKSDMRSFRRLEPSDGHPVHSLSLSPTGPLSHHSFGLPYLQSTMQPEFKQQLTGMPSRQTEYSVSMWQIQ